VTIRIIRTAGGVERIVSLSSFASFSLRGKVGKGELSSITETSISNYSLRCPRKKDAGGCPAA
jgi:hypothetical protein